MKRLLAAATCAAAWCLGAVDSVSAMPAIVDAAGSASQDAVPQGRLPDEVMPMRYRIDLTIVPARERFSGHVEIDAYLQRPTDHVFMHGLDLSVHKAEVWVGGTHLAARYTQVDPLGVVRLDLPRTLPAGDVRLVFDYDAPFGNTTAGIFRVKTDGQWHVWSHFEPLDARRAFPSFDQPGYKTPFEVSITTSPGLVTVSNEAESGVETVDGLVRHRFASTRPLPTYLVAFYVGPFATLAGEAPPDAQRASALPIRVVGEQRYRAQMLYVLENSKTVLALLEDYFGEAFPFSKLDQVGTPILNGGMENAGADIYGAPMLFVDKDSAPLEQGYFGELVSHELAHQWFGDLVTPEWWDDLWLNESFANWMGYRISTAWKPELAFGTKAVADALDAMDIDALDVGRAIHQPIVRSEDAEGAFDDITYAKGGQVIAMMAAYMGDSTFRDAVRLHLGRHRYGNANAGDFFRALADAGHDLRLVAAMQGFVDQQGVPQVSVHREGGRLWISQAPYAALGTTSQAHAWVIPVCWRTVPNGSRQCALLDKTSMALPAGSDAPLLPNADGTGYYRYTMADADWKALIAQGKALQPAEALTLVDSAWAAFRAGQLPFRTLLDMTDAMAGHAYGPASVASANQLLAMKRQGMTEGATSDALDGFLSRIYQPRLANLGLDLRAHAYVNEQGDRRQQRRELVGLLSRAGDTSTLRTLGNAADAYVHGDEKALDVDFYDDALSAYVKRHGKEGATGLWTLAFASTDESFRHAALAAVARSNDADVAGWMVLQLDDQRLRPTERVAVVLGLLSQPMTRGLGEQQTLSRFDQLEARTGHYGEVLLASPKTLCSASEADAFGGKMLALARSHQLPTLDIQRGMALATQCDALRQARGKDIAQTLDRLH